MINNKTYILIFTQGVVYGVGMTVLMAFNNKIGYLLFIIAVAISFILRRYIDRTKHKEVEQFDQELLNEFQVGDYTISGVEFYLLVTRAKLKLYKKLKQ